MLSKKMNLVMMVTLCLVLGLGSSALALTATQNGFSGLVTIPTADIQQTGDLTLGYEVVENGDVMLLNYGVDDNIELGLTGYWYDNNLQDDDVVLNAKMQFMEENKKQPALAMGLTDEDLYITASKNFNYYGLRGHIGIGNGRFDGIFAGLSKTLNPVSISDSKQNQFKMPVTTLMLEYNDHDLNAGAKFKLNSQFDFNVAVTDMSDLSAGINFNNSF
ncbi:YjbH domain-containing protein [Selenihalanaerobacter shriftii]|uniref:Exopolysaccharide biosynthesis protein YbjH n=1 Tax=Selenihalanaerobacter shriftii TaxID=142842 RepID=A0A1T4KYN8_9FIRM|nr:YjbH domain-containing protein [Selenihalanaerobacter shriftii]SJZ47483.1 Exopolysaccharide biosynthesis protein YbjH [Selenihalanaerobacter shriftii]